MLNLNNQLTDGLKIERNFFNRFHQCRKIKDDHYFTTKLNNKKD
jgi:hypothetical protein